MNIENLSKSKNVRAVIVSIGVLVVVLSILFAGINIGERRARFAGNYGDNFERNFMGPRGGQMPGRGFFNEMLPGGHGAVGEIISINLPQLIVSGPDNLEKTVLVSSTTVFRRFQENIQSSELKAGDFVVVIGNPNDNGQVEAKLIRIMGIK